MNQRIKQKYEELAGEGAGIAEALERGQAEAPLTRHFEALEREVHGAPLTAVLLGLGSEARTRALKWLYGNEYAVVSVTVVEKLGLVEIRVSEREFVLQHGGGERQVFEQLDRFLDAISDTDELIHPRSLDWVEPVRLGLQSDSPLRGVTLLVPERAELLLENPALLSRLSTQSNLTIIAAPLHHQLTDAEREAIDQLTESMDGLWPLLTVDELEEDASIPDPGWWQQYSKPRVQLPPKLLTTHVRAEMPPLLTEEHEATRSGLFVTQQARRLQDAVGALADAHEQRSRQLATRLRRESRKSRQLEAQAGDLQEKRQEWKGLQRQLTDTLPELNQGLSELQRQAKAPDSDLQKQLERFLNSLTEDDLEKEEGHSSIKLKISDRFLDDLQYCARDGLRAQFDRQVSWLRGELTTLRESLLNRAGSLSDDAVAIPPVELDDRALWDSVQDLFNVRLRYRGEMPRRGFWDRLKEGRQGAMGFMMMVGIGAMAFGSNIRQNPLFGLLLLFIFIGTVIYTFVKWRKDDAERIEKELDRVRDGVSSEVQRLINEVQRDLAGKFSGEMDRIKKRWGQAMEEAMEAEQKRHQQQLEQQRGGKKDRSRTVEQQQRELDGLRSGIKRLHKGAEDLLGQCLRALRSG